MSVDIANLLPKSNGAAALFYAKTFGWRVFPLQNLVAPGVCSCAKGAECPSNNQGKHPRISIPSGEGAVHPATSDEKTIADWWKKWPQANIGLWLDGSKLIVLDIDKNDKKDGFKGLQEIMAYEKQDKIVDTLVCNTPSGGQHMYFQFCEGVPNKANSLGPGLDTWQTLHYVILPPSNHVKGIYTWAAGATAPAPYPEWLKPKSRDKIDGSVGATSHKKAVGRPAKERLDPKDPEDVQRIEHALKYVDNTDRDKWVSVGFIIARAFEWSDKGFDIYDGWAKAAHNYDAKKTKEQYYVQSKTVPAKPLTAASVFEWARQHIDYKGWQAVDDRPYEIREAAADQLATLIQMGVIVPSFPIYQRGPKLVEIVPVNQEGGLRDDVYWFPKGSYILREVQPDQLAMRILPAKVKWMRKYAKGWKPASISVPICSTFLGIGNWPDAQKLRAFVQHPTLRDDGSLLMDRGFDRKSGLFLTDKIDVQVPKKATLAQAQAALKVLFYPFHEFRWIDTTVSKSAMLSAIFTVGIRHLFDDGVPLFAVDAPRHGSGKSKLVKAISNLWFGRPMSVTPYSNDHEEMKKHLASMLLNGDRVILFDNVHPNVKVNDPTLNALLTSGRITFRELGTQKMLELDSAASFFMTGNKLKIVGDMIRRTIRMQIDPGGLNPMDRKFKIDPLEGFVLQHRVKLLSAALTILTAFFHAGKPVQKGVLPIASFEQWSNTVRNLILWLGLDDVKESISQGYEVDDESMEIEHLLRELYDIPEMCADGLSSGLLMPIVEANKPLRDAMLPFINERSSMGITHPRVITTCLTQVANLVVDKKRLLRLGPVWVIRDEPAAAV